MNAVENKEKRKDSQLAREIEIALPIELSKKEQIKLVQDFVKSQFINQGMIADINIHESDSNPHAHIMLTTRKINSNGFGEKVRDWNKKENLMKWREEWANIQNLYLAKNGFNLQVDHRSHVDRDIHIIPGQKKGVINYSDGEFDRALEINKIRHENGKIIIESPEVALDHLSRYSSTFTMEDILQYVNEHADEDQFDEALYAVCHSPELLVIESNDYDRFTKYTTKSLLKTEEQMLSNASELSTQKTHIIDQEFIDQAAHNCSLSNEQKGVLNQTINGSDIHAIIGHAGTGKSYTLAAIKEAYEAQGYSLQGCSLSGVAAENLEHSSGIKSTTIFRKLHDWDKK